MSRTAEEILYPAQDFRIDIVMGEGAAARTLTLEPAALTLVGATTRTACSRRRSATGSATFRLDYYDPGELGTIVHRSRASSASNRGDAGEIARARAARPASRTASCARRDRRAGAPRGQDHEEIAAEALTLLEIDDQGLDREARDLRGRSRSSRRGPVGVSTLSASLGGAETIEDVYEPSCPARLHPRRRGADDHELGRAHTVGAGSGGKALLTSGIGRRYRRAAPRSSCSACTGDRRVRGGARCRVPAVEVGADGPIELRLERIDPEPGFGM